MIIRHAGRWLAGAAVVLLVWAAIMLVMPFVGSGRDLVVLGAPAKVVTSVLGAGGTIIEMRAGVVIARSNRPGFAARLYRGGARLVLENRLTAGCFKRSA